MTGRWLWRLAGRSGVWKLVGAIHGRLYRWSGGRIGQRAGGLDHLLLTTTGARSGAPRTVPLTYMADGDRFVLVASNGGADRHPAWWLNLAKKPRATIQVGGRTLTVEAHRADAAERAALWPRLKGMNPIYAIYEQLTAREIPVVVLRSRA